MTYTNQLRPKYRVSVLHSTKNNSDGTRTIEYLMKTMIEHIMNFKRIQVKYDRIHQALKDLN